MYLGRSPAFWITYCNYYIPIVVFDIIFYLETLPVASKPWDVEACGHCVVAGVFGRLWLRKIQYLNRIVY
ncbi:hypothetical protein F5Y11DRAFT_323969 [Daldinia sp. FL1419]|nr:hypothetical protein F5Y11DRAFT_323969 [Daldinia sp. FL1419]